MSDDIYNVVVPVPMDANTFSMNEIKIEFVKDIKREYNEFLLNRFYNYQPFRQL